VFLFHFSLKVGAEKFVNERVAMAPDFLGRADGAQFSIEHHPNAIRHPEGQVAIVTDHQGRDVNPRF
jgi:hypothetical protein